MTHVCHLFDDSASWEERVAASQLAGRLPKERYAQHFVCIGSEAAGRLRRLEQPISVLPSAGGFAPLSAPALSRHLSLRNVDVVHAWGVGAALAARLAGCENVVVELHNPRITRQELKLMRILSRPDGFAVVCSAQIMRRRLIEGGIAPELCAVVRPGVDFGFVSDCRRSSIRAQLGLGENHHAVLVPEPTGPSDGALEAVWAVILAAYLEDDLRVIVPGTSRACGRIERFAACGPKPGVVLCPGDRFGFEQLTAVADALIVASPEDARTACIAWAMASGASVIASAVHSNAELIANKLNGLLFNPRGDESLAVPIARLLLDRDAQAKPRDVARAHAYEVFSVSQFVRQHERLYQNVLGGIPPGEGVVDTAACA